MAIRNSNFIPKRFAREVLSGITDTKIIRSIYYGECRRKGKAQAGKSIKVLR